MKEKEESSKADWPDKAQFYIQGMSMENSLLQNYRVFFGAIEAILIVAWFGLQLGPASKLLIFVSAVLVCIGWIIICALRGAEVTAWRDKVKEVTKGTEAESFIKQRFEPKPRAAFLWRVTSARFWLSLALPLLLISLWSLLLSSSWWVGLVALLFLVVLVSFLRKIFKIDLLQL